jgi:RNA polymerase sigma-70 factor (ECF subfamily)
MAMQPDPQQPADRDLVAASRRGDRVAYAALIHRYAGRVYAVCLGILGDASESEDMTQETFMRGLTSINTLRDGERFPAWITQIARNLCRDNIRTEKRRKQLLERRIADATPIGPDVSELLAALQKLPEKHRIPLALYYLDGRDVATLAEELGTTEAAAYTRLSRARRALRNIIEGAESK